MFSVIRRGLVICVMSLCLGLFVNAVSPRGIPITGPVPRIEIEGLEEIGLEGVLQVFQGGEGVFVDARSAEEYSTGHIPGALLLTQEMLEDSVSSLTDLIPRDTLIVTYCSGAGCGSSREVADLLREEGYSNVKIFYGGWDVWKGAGYPVEKNAV